MSISNFKPLLIILLFSILGFGIYSNTLEMPFHFDDYTRIETNPYIRISELTYESLLKSAFNEKSSKSRPLGNITFALNYYFHQYDLKGYHIVNIVIHILTGIFLYFFILTILNLPSLKSKYTSPNLIAFFAALLWLVHPLQTQSVTYIVQRLNSLSAMFYVLSFWFYLKGRIAVRRKTSWLWFVNATLAWIFALGCKQTAAMLPFLIFIFEWYFFQDRKSDWLKRNLVYVLIILVLFGLVSFLYIGADPVKRLSSIGDYSHKEFTILQRALTQPRVVIYYLSLIFFPHPARLNLDYDFPLSYSLINPVTTLISLGLIMGLLIFAVYLSRKERLISFCILWFLGNLVIESSVIPVAIIFEHRNYLPSMFVCLILVILAYRFVQLEWLRLVIFSIIVIILSFWTYQRNQVWENDITLWSDVVEKSPNKARPHFNLGTALAKSDRIEDAIPHYLKALEINPNKAQFYVNLGDAMEKQGKPDKAFEHYKTALTLKPNLAEAHNNMGALLAKKGRTDEAIGFYINAIEIKPYYAVAHFNLGGLLVEQGKVDQGISHYFKAINLQPDYPEAYSNLGSVFLNLGDTEKAIHHLGTALQMDPNLVEAYNNLGIALMQEGRIEAAISQFQKALQLNQDFILAENNLRRALAIQKELATEIWRLQDLLKDNPDNVELHFQLGNLYFRKGDQRQAMQRYKKALQLDPKFVPALNNLALVTAANKEYYKALTVFLDILNYAPDDAETHYNIACMYSRLKRVDESIEWLQKAIDKGYANWESIKRDSDLDNIRGSIAYKNLIRGH